MIDIIAAMDKNQGIGYEGKLPWYIKEELQFFKQATMGKTVVVGSETYKTLPPLRGRRVLELTRSNPLLTIDTIVKMSTEGQHIMIGGGEQIYKAFIPLADNMYISHIDGEYQCDRFFPEIKEDEWKVISEVPMKGFTIKTYTREENRNVL